MKIVFLCRSLEPGRDGVGDYTRRLAGELIRQGHPCRIVGLNDPHISKTVQQSQEIEGTQVPVLRFPQTIPWADRANLTQKWLDAFDPDWISIQFVPFAFHPKGIIKEFLQNFDAIISSRRVHIMFHELWILWRFPLPLRQRLLGQVQKFYIRKGLKKIRPDAVATQLSLYQNELNSIGVKADVHLLHGNIPVCSDVNAKQWLADKCPQSDLSRITTAGFFGNILPTLNLTILTEKLKNLKIPRDQLLILLAGKTGDETARHRNLIEQELKDVAKFHQLGELDEREASYYFSALDYGLTSYPPELMKKSGSVAAMLEHGLTVFPCGQLGKDSKSANTDAAQTPIADEPWTVKKSAALLVRQLESSNQQP